MILTNSIGNENMHKMRQSNLELLRIVAMFLVLFGHIHLRIHPFPNMETVNQNPIQSFFDVMLSCVSTMGVGIFIAISGWFGIHFRKSGIVSLLFQVFFFLWTIYISSVIFNQAVFNADGIKVCLTFYNGYWFVLGYFGLYLLSPILNSFIETASQNLFKTVLLSFLLFQSYYSWITAWYDYYNGYSIILFSFIYLTSAYFRKYPVKWIEEYALWLFIATVLIIASIATFSLSEFDHAFRQVRDDNPLVILACVLLLLSFIKLKFQNKVVNWLAASCFSVYLIHFNPYIYPSLMNKMMNLYEMCSGLVYCFMLLLSLSVVYLSCTLYDQLRKVSWKGIIFFARKISIQL